MTEHNLEALLLEAIDGNDFSPLIKADFDKIKQRSLQRLQQGEMKLKQHIYHIVLPEKWDEAASEKFYEAESFAVEGFIHCSFAEQIEGVLERYYSGTDRVVILEIDPAKLKSRLVEEESTNNEIYPHIYGNINKDAVVGVEERELERG